MSHATLQGEGASWIGQLNAANTCTGVPAVASMLLLRDIRHVDKLMKRNPYLHGHMHTACVSGRKFTWGKAGQVISRAFLETDTHKQDTCLSFPT
eukprot:320552-Chlamydomonas_euryale.AAC.42